jgi:hypothetical protein
MMSRRTQPALVRGGAPLNLWDNTQIERNRDSLPRSAICAHLVMHPGGKQDEEAWARPYPFSSPRGEAALAAVGQSI